MRANLERDKLILRPRLRHVKAAMNAPESPWPFGITMLVYNGAVFTSTKVVRKTEGLPGDSAGQLRTPGIQERHNGSLRRPALAGALLLLVVAWVLGGPAVDFDSRFYLRANPDVAADPVYAKDPLKHYLEIGRMEGRRPSARAPRCYPTAGRPPPCVLMPQDSGPIIRHGDGPDRCDYLGAREAIAFQVGDTYYLHYDGAGPRGWLACLATSKDLHHWDLKGPVLDLGDKGEDDSGTASSPWTIFDGKLWHMFYVGTPFTSPPPNRIPAVPYYTLTATAPSPGRTLDEKEGFPSFPHPAGHLLRGYGQPRPDHQVWR